MQEELFIEDIWTAVRAIVDRAGGLKGVGSKLWPAKTPVAAGQWLSDCLNPDRPAKLDPDELVALLKIGREHEVHTLIHYLADEAGYSRPTPISPEDERAQLERQYIEATKALGRIVSRMERISGPVRAVG